MIEVNLKQKLRDQKQKEINHKKDLDLKLYLDFLKELIDYRVSLVDKLPIKELCDMRIKHKFILERLSKRLKIPTIRSCLNNHKK